MTNPIQGFDPALLAAAMHILQSQNQDQAIDLPQGKYAGSTKNGQPHGRGIFTYHQPNDLERLRYEGEFSEGVIQGKGKMQWADGVTYEGWFFNDKMEGPGVYRESGGAGIYEGNFKEDVFHGKGRYKFPDGAYFEGTWINGEKDGPGILVHYNGKGIRCSLEGTWKKDKREGKFTRVGIDGTEYITFEDDVQQSSCVLL